VVGAGIMILTAPATGDALVATPGQASTVGALFTVGAGGKLGAHFCTASVVASPDGDLILTAAHCMATRSADQVAFVPDYANGKMPYGVWKITNILVDPNWSSTSDPDDDFAFLQVSQAGSRVAIQQLTGAETIQIGTSAGGKVKVAGYPDGQDAMISCVNTVLAFTSTQFAFDCGGFEDGTSGSPLLVATATGGSTADVIGVIGGFEQGGDTPSVSYASRFGPRMEALYKAAIAASRS
jgi:V8-like Glu-specific endopeptidase